MTSAAGVNPMRCVDGSMVSVTPCSVPELHLAAAAAAFV